MLPSTYQKILSLLMLRFLKMSLFSNIPIFKGEDPSEDRAKDQFLLDFPSQSVEFSSVLESTMVQSTIESCEVMKDKRESRQQHSTTKSLFQEENSTFSIGTSTISYLCYYSIT